MEREAVRSRDDRTLLFFSFFCSFVRHVGSIVGRVGYETQ